MTMPLSETDYDRLAETFSRIYAETHSIAIALEILDAQRARQAVSHLPGFFAPVATATSLPVGSPDGYSGAKVGRHSRLAASSASITQRWSMISSRRPPGTT